MLEPLLRVKASSDKVFPLGTYSIQDPEGLPCACRSHLLTVAAHLLVNSLDTRDE